MLQVQPSLRRLLDGLSAIAQVVTEGEPLPAFDWHSPLLTLPRTFATTLDTIPAEVPYLAADPAGVARWRARLGPVGGLKVGLVWAGSGDHIRDADRSSRLGRLLPLFAVSGVRWFSLQVGPRAADLARLRPGTMEDLTPGLADFADTAAAIAALDLVVTVDSAVAHLAGALGRPAWILLPHVPDWRWQLGRDDSPWYPTLRLFRQPQRGDWDSVAMRVAVELARLATDA